MGHTQSGNPAPPAACDSAQSAKGPAAPHMVAHHFASGATVPGAKRCRRNATKPCEQQPIHRVKICRARSRNPYGDWLKQLAKTPPWGVGEFPHQHLASFSVDRGHYPGLRLKRHRPRAQRQPRPAVVRHRPSGQGCGIRHHRRKAQPGRRGIPPRAQFRSV